MDSHVDLFYNLMKVITNLTGNLFQGFLFKFFSDIILQTMCLKKKPICLI